MRFPPYRSLVAVLVPLIALACGDAPRDVDDDDGGDSSSNSSSSGMGGSGPTSSSSGAGASTGMEPGQLMGITAAHNQIRGEVDTGEPIPDLTWSPQLAEVAQAYADVLAGQGCDLVHSGNDYGENLFWGSATYSPADVVGAWASEIECFTYTEFPEACGCTCGHYTQIVWRNTTSVGCGIGACPGGGEVWVCNYDPPGNFIGQLPY
jgi:uncharacterized protein YkwD